MKNQSKSCSMLPKAFDKGKPADTKGLHSAALHWWYRENLVTVLCNSLLQTHLHSLVQVLVCQHIDTHLCFNEKLLNTLPMLDVIMRPPGMRKVTWLSWSSAFFLPAGDQKNSYFPTFGTCTQWWSLQLEMCGVGQPLGLLQKDVGDFNNWTGEPKAFYY